MRRMFSENQIIRLIQENSSKVVFELVKALGSLQYEGEGDEMVAYYESTGTLPAYDLYIFTMNNSFIITPLSQTGQALCCGSFAYDPLGDSMLARVRFNQSTNFKITFDKDFTSAIFTNEMTPDGYLFGIKL